MTEEKPLEDLTRDERYERFQEGIRAGTIERSPKLGCLGTLAALIVPGYNFHLWNKGRKEAIKHDYVSAEGNVRSFTDAVLIEAVKGVAYFGIAQGIASYFMK